MAPELKEKILQTVEETSPIIESIAIEQYGVDLRNRAQVRNFLANNPNFMLPNLYIGIGNSENIYINYHDSIFNGLPHSHDFFEIVYVGEGEAEDFIDNTHITLREGDFCIHNPRATHAVTVSEDSFLVNLLISKELFENEIFAQISRDPELDRFFNRYLTVPDSSPRYMAFFDNAPEITGFFDMVFTEYFHPDRSEALIVSLLTVLFGNVFRNFKGDTLAGKMTDYIFSHLETVTLKQMARDFGYHEKYLSSLIKTRTGRSFKQLVIELRMRRAAQLLRDTERSIEEIAASVGYTDPSSFYEKFRRQFGKSPKAYRKENALI